MPTVLSAQHPLHVETTGDDRRPALLLLNPLGTTLEVWDPLVEEFASRNWVIRFDTRGHGRSAHSVGAYELGDLVADAIAVLDALEVPRTHIVGDSMGAMVAAVLASEYPDRVDSLVLSSVGVHLGTYDWWDETIQRVESGGMSAIVSHLDDIFFSEAWKEAVPDLLEQATQMLLAVDPKTYLAGARMLRDASLEGFEERIRATTLLIGGQDDPVFQHFPITDLLSMIPGSEAVHVEGARHRVLLEQPDLLAPLINEFLSDPDAR